MTKTQIKNRGFKIIPIKNKCLSCLNSLGCAGLSAQLNQRQLWSLEDENNSKILSIHELTLFFAVFSFAESSKCSILL